MGRSRGHRRHRHEEPEDFVSLAVVDEVARDNNANLDRSVYRTGGKGKEWC